MSVIQSDYLLRRYINYCIERWAHSAPTVKADYFVFSEMKKAGAERTDTDLKLFFPYIAKRLSQYDRDEIAAAGFIRAYRIEPRELELRKNDAGQFDLEAFSKRHEGVLQAYVIRAQLLKGDLLLFNHYFFTEAAACAPKNNWQHTYSPAQIDLALQFIKSQEHLTPHVLTPKLLES